jgi:hypothetical protein
MTPPIDLARLRVAAELAASWRKLSLHAEDGTFAGALDIATLLALVAAVEALRKLRAELSDVQIEGVRMFCGNTNAAVLTLRCQEADTALAPFQAPEATR